MIQLLSIRDQRYLQILKSLYRNQSQTLTQLSKISKSSKRNVQIDIASLNNFIAPLFIATNSKEGCILLCPDDISIDYIYELILANSFEFSLLESIFFEKNKRLEDYAEVLYTSVSTLKRTIKKTNKHLASLDIQINTAPIQLVGNETNICNMMINLFSEKYRFDEIPFSKLQIQLFDHIFLLVNQKYMYTNNFSDRQRLKLYFLVLITRMQNEHITTAETDITDNFDMKLLDNYILKSMFKSVFKIPLTKQTVIQLTQFFIKSEFAVDYEHLVSLIEESPAHRKIVQTFDDFLIFLGEEFNLSLKNKEQLLLELFNVKQLTSGKSFVLHDTRKEFVEGLLKESSYASDVVYSGIKKAAQLSKEFPILDYSLISYIFITHWEGFIDFLQSLKPPCLAGIFFNSDTEHAQFIASYLESNFNGVIHFKVLESITLKDAVKESINYSFIITNISQLPIKHIPCIGVNMFPNANDIQKISNTYDLVNH